MTADPLSKLGRIADAPHGEIGARLHSKRSAVEKAKRASGMRRHTTQALFSGVSRNKVQAMMLRLECRAILVRQLPGVQLHWKSMAAIVAASVGDILVADTVEALTKFTDVLTAEHQMGVESDQFWRKQDAVKLFDPGSRFVGAPGKLLCTPTRTISPW